MKNIKIFLVLFILLSCMLSCTTTEDKATAQQDSISHTQDTNQATSPTDEEGIDFVTAIIIIVIVILVVAFSFFFFRNVFPVKLWFKSWTGGAPVGIRSFTNMYFQKIPPEKIVNNRIVAHKAGVDITTRDLEDYYLANVDIDKIVNAQIEAKNSGVNVTVEQFSKAYLAKVNIDDLLAALILVQSSDIDADFDTLVQLHHSGVDIVKIIKSKITAKNSGFKVELKKLSTHSLAGGNMDKTVEAYIAAKKANLKDFDFDDIADLDLAGYEVFNIVEKAIIPRVIEGDRVRGVARDGVELSMKLKVTLRAKLKSIIGNPEESTILAKINESLATEIGLSEKHYKVLENPYMLAERVEAKNLDVDAAFEILSIDVSDISIGKDMHAELKKERAGADAQKAKVDLLTAEQQLKQAIASAFIGGKISVAEYENLMNTQADTKMRNAIGNAELNTDEEEEEHGRKNDN